MSETQLQLNAPWTCETHELSEGFSSVVYDRFGQALNGLHLTEDQARLIHVAPEMLEACRLVEKYDELLLKYQGPAQVLFDGDVKEIDDAYDAMVAACRLVVFRATPLPVEA